MVQSNRNLRILTILISLTALNGLPWLDPCFRAYGQGQRFTSISRAIQNAFDNVDSETGSGQNRDEEEIRLIVEKANRALQEGDGETILSLSSDDERNHWLDPQTIRNLFTGPTKLRIDSFAIRRVTIEGDHAVCRLYLQRRDPLTQQLVSGYGLNHINAYLQKYSGQWKIRWFLGAEPDFAAALYAARTIEERRLVLATEPDLDAGEALIRFNFRLTQNGKYDSAGEVLALTRWLAHERSDQALLARAVLNEGLLQAAQGNQHEAFAKFQEAQRLSDALLDRTGQARALESISELYLQQGNLAQTTDYALRALDQIKNANETANLVTLRLANKTLGDAYFAQLDYDKALQFYQRNEALDVKYGGFPDTNIDIGMVKLRHGDTAEAMRILGKALVIKEPDGPGTGTGVEVCFLLGQIAELQIRLGDAESALVSARRAVAIANELRNLDLLWLAENAEARAHLALKQSAAAQLSFKRAIAAIEAQRRALAGTEQAYRQFLTSRTGPYESLISLLLAEGKTVEALAAAERSKARVLADVLRGGRINISPWMNATERTQDDQLKTQLANLNRQLTLESLKPFPDATNTATLSKQQEQARMVYEDWQTRFAAAHPQLRLAVSDLPPMTLAGTSQLVQDNSEALLEYVVTDDQVFLFVLTQAAPRSLQKSVGPPATAGGSDKRAQDASPSSPESAPLQLRAYPLNVAPAQLVGQALEFQRRLSERNADFQTQARELYRVLLGPAQQQLQSKRHLIVVPDRELWGVPFQALMPDANHYLIQQAAVSYAPSLTALSEMRMAGSRLRAGVGDAGELLALGNPQLSANTATHSKAQYRDGKLGSLPDAEKEVAAIGRLYGPRKRIVTGAQASEELLKREASRYRYVHLATHGVANADNPLYSHVLLAPGEAGREDGWLEAWEIMRLKLHAEMVVLSACETANGRISAGEGVIGLSWAFMVAGVPTTVVSQWNVDSSSTGKLMLEFYRQLRSPVSARRSLISKDEALRRAALTVMRQPETAHPFYWSAFAVVGDPR